MSEQTDWRVVLKRLSELTSLHPDERQLSMAEAAGIKIKLSTPRLVAAAVLKAALDEPLDLRQRERGELSAPSPELEEDVRHVVERAGLAPVEPGTVVEARGWRRLGWLIVRREAIQSLRPVSGDIVQAWPHSDPQEVSSLSKDGRLFFRGGRTSAWPDRVKSLAPLNESGAAAEQLRKEARNTATKFRHDMKWSLSQAQRLREYVVESRPNHDDLDHFAHALETAASEEPLQKLFETRPYLLTSLLGGRVQVSIPRPNLGGKYIPDFLIADVDSRGIRWVGVELQSPLSKTTLRTKNDFDEQVREGIAQAREWRDWLQNNLDFARRPKTQDGLGLFGIDPNLDCVVIAGRRDLLSGDAPRLRQRVWNEQRVDVMTYDRLYERLLGLLEFSGPPSHSPHVIKRYDAEEAFLSGQMRAF
jgi:hypothetical protein